MLVGFVDGILRTGVTGTPGTFAYSSGTSPVLAAILAQATGLVAVFVTRGAVHHACPTRRSTDGRTRSVVTYAVMPRLGS